MFYIYACTMEEENIKISMNFSISYGRQEARNKNNNVLIELIKMQSLEIIVWKTSQCIIND